MKLIKTILFLLIALAIAAFFYIASQDVDIKTRKIEQKISIPDAGNTASDSNTDSETSE